MKKRILALALVVITLVTVLTGCAYRYDRKDMSKYATVADNYAGLNALLNSITITVKDVKGSSDANTESLQAALDFGPASSDSRRWDKVLQSIDATLAGKIAGDAAKLSGEEDLFDYRQKIVYAYYCTVEKDGQTYLFNTEYMLSSKFANFISNPTYTDGKANEKLLDEDALTKLIFDKLVTEKIADKAKYETDTSSATELAVGDQVLVSYTYTNTATTKTVTAKYALVTVGEMPEAGATKIEQLLAGKKISTTIKSTEDAPLEFYVTNEETGEEEKCVVDSLIVDSKIKGGVEVEVHFTATEEKSFTWSENTATDKKVKVDVGEIITYHVYPVYVNAVEELTAVSIIKTIFGESITASSLDVFNDENKALKELVEEVASKKTAYDSAKSAASGTNATQEQKQTETEAKEALDAAMKALVEKVEGDEDLKAKIVESYKNSIYDSLEAQYDEAVKDQIGKQIWQWMKEKVVVNTANLPKAAVKEAKDRILAGHKNTYYTGSNSTTKIPYTETYKTFKEYLAAVAYSGKDVDATVDAEARAEVAEIVRVYAVAQHYNIPRVTDAEISTYITENYFVLYYNLIISGGWSSSSYPTPDSLREMYGDTAIRCAMTFDRLMDYFLATDDTGAHVKYTTIKNVVVIPKT